MPCQARIHLSPGLLSGHSRHTRFDFGSAKEIEADEARSDPPAPVSDFQVAGFQPIHSGTLRNKRGRNELRRDETLFFGHFSKAV